MFASIHEDTVCPSLPPLGESEGLYYFRDRGCGHSGVHLREHASSPGTIMEAHWKQHATLNPGVKSPQGLVFKSPRACQGRRKRTDCSASGLGVARGVDTPYRGSHVNQRRVEGRCEKEEMDGRQLRNQDRG